MIAKISPERSGHPGKLVSYLFGPGKANEHRDQHTVAGSVHYPGAGPEIRAQVTADIQMPKQMWPTVEFTGGHIYHLSLSLSSSEGTLSDEKWERIAHDYMQQMKLEDPAKAPLRWSAVRHGVSAEGNDHVHIVANLIREDGTKATIWQDQERAKGVLSNIEQMHGLKVLQSRLASVGAGAVPYTAGEAVQARETKQPIERVDLERRVRAAATAAPSEADFVKLLRADKIAVRPYPSAGAVTGYSVATTDFIGKPGRFFAGGQLARDLTLPRLRGSWPDAGGSRAEAEVQWRSGTTAKRVKPVAPKVTTADLAAASQALEALETDLHLAAPPEFAELSQDLAGAAAAASTVADPTQRGELVRATREVGGWAGTKRPVPRVRPSRMQLVATILMHALNPESEQSQAFMRRQLIEQILKLLRVHRSSRPVPAPTHGRGVAMSQASDDVDGVFSDALTTGVVTALAVANQNADERRANREAAADRVSAGFFGRFTRQHTDVLSPKNPVPVGFRESFDDAGWAALTESQRHALDPDRIGRWLTDVDPARLETGPNLRPTATQSMMIADLGTELGEPAHAAAVTSMNRAQAAELMQRLESRLDPDAARRLYHTWGVAYRNPEGTFEFRDDNPAPAPAAPVTAAATASAPAAPASTPAATAAAIPSQPVPGSSTGVPFNARAAAAGMPAVFGERTSGSRLDDPLQWRTAGEPVTKKQAFTLGEYGVPANEIGQINKGWASTVLNAFDKDGEVAGHVAMDRALAAMENVASPVNQPKPQPAQTKNRGPRQT